MFPVLSDLLGRLSVGRKLALIYLLDLSAVIFISSILIHEKFVVIDFSRKELAGNAYIRELRPSLVSLADAPMTRGQTDTFSAEVPRIEQRHGAGLKSHDASLDFGRSLSQLRSTTDDARGAAQSAALDKGRALVTRVGNQSNLILDPDLDSYYTMSIVLLRYPELLELVHGITLQMEREATALQPWGNEARTRYLILEGRLDAVAKGIDVDYREAFAASDDALKKSLGPHQARVGTSIERFRQAARATLDASGANGPGRVAQSLQVDDVRRVRRELLVDLDAAWARAGDELDRLLDQRIHGFFVRMALHLGTALLMLAAILSAVWFVARQIAMPLASLADVADGVRRSGDHRLRAQWSSRDEIGRLVTAFNGMLDQLGRERALQDELTARTHAAAAQKDLVEAIPIPLLVTEIPHHGVLHVNAPAQRWLGDVPTDPWAAGLDAPVRARFFQQLADREAVDEFEVQWRTAGEPVWAVLSARRLLYQGRDALLTTFTPVNHLKAMEQRLELWAKVFEASTESIVILDAQHRILTVNRAFSRHTGFDAGDAAGEGIGFLLADEADASTMNDLWPNVDKRGAWQGEISVRRRNGSRYPAWVVMSVVRAAADRISHYIVSSLDISDRKASEERIRYLAHHDTLTGLPNRSLCNERLRLAMQQAERSGHKVAVLFIDLDRFKTINDSLGHHVGDELLRSVSQRLQAAVRSGDTVSRLGGDEFIVVLSRVDNIDEVVTVVEHRLVPGIREKHDVGGAELHVSCSIGIAIYPDDARDIDEVLRHADVAMYQAKALGRDAVHFFTPELNARAHRRLRIESLLRQATDRGELTLHYQPCIAADGTAVIGFEALIRWTSPELGPVAPTEFIAIAEESRLIRHIGQWVIEQTCRDQAAWRAQGLADVAVSVNLSALQLRDDTLVATLHDAMRRHGTRPQSIELELTESTLMETVDHTLAQLDALRALGVTLSIDDFGTGYSSLSYLKRFPIDRLKIDSSFVRDMLVDTADAEIIRAIVALGHSLGLRVVAEGVENEDTARALRVAGCDELQGFYIARPMPADQVMEWLREARVTAQAQVLVRSDQD